MNLMNRVKNYLIDEELKITILKNKVNILNYDNIKNFTLKEVEIEAKEELIKIKGDELVVSKLVEDEILIEGVIKSIELR